MCQTCNKYPTDYLIHLRLTGPLSACLLTLHLLPAAGLFRPTLPAGSIGPAVGTLGALVMPYNLFFHSAVVGSRCEANKRCPQLASYAAAELAC